VNQFNFRIGNIEARTTYRKDVIEIVQWETSTCFVIVCFMQHGDPEHWEAVFVWDRPLSEQVNWHHLRELIQASYKFLNGWEVQP